MLSERSLNTEYLTSERETKLRITHNEKLEHDRNKKPMTAFLPFFCTEQTPVTCSLRNFMTFTVINESDKVIEQS